MGRIILAGLLLAVLAACAGGASPSPVNVPEPTCGGLKIKIENALLCGQVARIALDALADRAPQQLARGVVSIDVRLATCPRNEVPPQIACGTEEFAQLVTVTFGPAAAGGPIEPSLTVAVAPVSGVVLGIANPLVK